MEEKEIRLENMEIRQRPEVPAGSSLVLSNCIVVCDLDYTASDIDRLEVVNTRMDKALILNGALLNELVVDSSNVDAIHARQLASHTHIMLRVRCRNTAFGFADYSHSFLGAGFNVSGCTFRRLMLDDLSIEQGGINLACCTIDEDLDMRQAYIKGEANLAGLTVRGNADLRDSVFNGWFDASRSTWHGSFDTSRPLTRSRQRASSAKHDCPSDDESFQFGLGCDLLGATFHGPVRMIRSSFGGDLIFLETKASSEASIDLRGAIVAGTLDASRVLSEAGLDLGDSQLVHFVSAGSTFQGISMNGAEAKILVEFHDIQISGDLSLKDLKVSMVSHEEGHRQRTSFKRPVWRPLRSACRKLLQVGVGACRVSPRAISKCADAGDGIRSYEGLPRGLRLFAASIGGRLDLTGAELPQQSLQFAELDARRIDFDREELAASLRCRWGTKDGSHNSHRLNGLMYRALKEASRKAGQPKDEDWALYLEIREMNLSNYYRKREEHVLKTPLGLIVNIGFFHLFWRLACGFGLRLPNLLLSSFLFIFLFGLLYHAFPQQFISVDETTRAYQMDEQEPQDGSDSNPMHLGMPWLSSIYFSAGTFTSLGSNTTAFLQWRPIGILVIMESFLGVFMMTVFVGAAIRKILRTA